MKTTFIKKVDKTNKFFSIFCPETGFYFRSNVAGTKVEPFKADYPELIDIGIMGHCRFGQSGICIQSGVECYQNGLNIIEPNMTFENFKKIIDESKGKTFQIALGGRGDPDQHEHFREILAYSRENKIVPNFTTSGIGIDENIAKLCSKYCGAVAVSWYRNSCTIRAINTLLKAGVKTNIHYVLSKTSIDEAINRLETDNFPNNINAIIFLLHKPIGLGSKEKVLDANDERLHKFFLLTSKKHKFKIGFDSCTVSGILNFTDDILEESFDACEAARWSMYISSDMIAMPCSFGNTEPKLRYNLKNSTISDAWKSSIFEDFRLNFIKSCSSCPKKRLCLGGCPIAPEINLCNREYKQTVLMKKEMN